MKITDYKTYIESRIVIDRNGCWLWQGCRRHGYGVCRAFGTTINTHRLSWRVYRGQIPKGKCVLHKCDVKQCINPDHLLIGTHKENTADMWAKGRAVVGNHAGEHNGKCKLTADQAKAIYNLIVEGQYSKKQIAKKFGVSASTVYLIGYGKVWAHATTA